MRAEKVEGPKKGEHSNYTLTKTKMAVTVATTMLMILSCKVK